MECSLSSLRSDSYFLFVPKSERCIIRVIFDYPGTIFGAIRDHRSHGKVYSGPIGGLDLSVYDGVRGLRRIDICYNAESVIHVCVLVFDI